MSKTFSGNGLVNKMSKEIIKDKKVKNCRICQYNDGMGGVNWEKEECYICTGNKLPNRPLQPHTNWSGDWSNIYG
jgi:hypothetical protein